MLPLVDEPFQQHSAGTLTCTRSSMNATTLLWRWSWRAETFFETIRMVQFEFAAKAWRSVLNRAAAHRVWEMWTCTRWRIRNFNAACGEEERVRWAQVNGRGGGSVTCHLIASAVEMHSAVDVAADMQKLMMIVEDDEESIEFGTRARTDIRVDFEAGSVLCYQCADPIGRCSQSIIFSLSSRPRVRCVRHHMHDDYDKIPSFVDLRVAQQVHAAQEMQAARTTILQPPLHPSFSQASPHFPRSSKVVSTKSLVSCSAPPLLAPIFWTAAALACTTCLLLRNCCSPPRTTCMNLRRGCLFVAVATISVCSCCASAARYPPWLPAWLLPSTNATALCPASSPASCSAASASSRVGFGRKRSGMYCGAFDCFF